jgi:hypothetical protein
MMMSKQPVFQARAMAMARARARARVSTTVHAQHFIYNAASHSPERACSDIMTKLMTINSCNILAWHVRGDHEMAEYIEKHAMDPDIVDILFKKNPLVAMRLIDVRDDYINQFGWELMKHMVANDCHERGIASAKQYLEDTHN